MLRPWHCTALVENDKLIQGVYLMGLLIHCTIFISCALMLKANAKYWKREEFFIRAMLIAILVGEVLFITEYVLLLVLAAVHTQRPHKHLGFVWDL